MMRLSDEWFMSVSSKRRLRRAVRRADDARDRGEWKVAAEGYRQALRLAPDDAGLWMQAGHACKEAADLEGAQAAYARAESLAPGDADMHIQLGHFHKLIGQEDRAARHYQAAVDSGASDEHALHFLAARVLDRADAARNARAFERAAQLYQEAVQADPRGPIFVQLGNCLKESGSLLAAQKAYLSALELGPDDADCLLQLGHLMKVTGDLGQAESYFERSAQLDPDRLDAAAELSALRAKTPEPEGGGRAAAGLPPPRTQVVGGAAAAILQNIQFAQVHRRS